MSSGMNCNWRSSTLVPSSERVNVMSDVWGTSEGKETRVTNPDSNVNA